MAQTVGFQIILDEFRKKKDYNLKIPMNRLDEKQRKDVEEAIYFLKRNGYIEDLPHRVLGAFSISVNPETIAFLERILP